MIATITYRPNAQKTPGLFDILLTDSVLTDICQKVTGQSHYQVVKDRSTYNKGRLIYVEYNNVLYYVSLSEENIGGRNSSLQSVPTALNLYYADTRRNKHLCYYFLPHNGNAFTAYHLFVYKMMVLVNHARPDLKVQMMRTGICYTRIGDSKGSILVTYGYERIQYVLLHSNGTDAHLFRLRSKGCFQIWTKETIMKYGFNPQSSPYYAVFLFDNSVEYPVSKNPMLNHIINSYRSKIRPLTDICDYK